MPKNQTGIDNLLSALDKAKAVQDAPAEFRASNVPASPLPTRSKFDLGVENVRQFLEDLPGSVANLVRGVVQAGSGAPALLGVEALKHIAPDLSPEIPQGAVAPILPDDSPEVQEAKRRLTAYQATQPKEPGALEGLTGINKERIQSEAATGQYGKIAAEVGPTVVATILGARKGIKALRERTPSEPIPSETQPAPEPAPEPATTAAPPTIDHLPNVKAALENATPLSEAAVTTMETLPALKQSLGKVAAETPGQSNLGLNLNLARLDTPEDVKAFIRQTAESNAQFEPQRRGIIPHEETAAAAEQLDLTPDKLARMKPGKALNAEELLAARRINVTTAEAVRAAVKAVQENDSTENLLSLQAAMQRHVGVQNAVQGATAEAGRALSQFRIAASALGDAEKSNYQRVLDQLGGREVTAELARKLAEIPETDIEGLNRFLRGATQFSTADKVSSYWTNSVLSGPRTHLRNLVSNVSFGALQIPEKMIRGWVDAPLSKIANRPQEFFSREAIPAAYGWFAGLPDGLRRASYIIRNGFDVADAAKLDSPHQFEFGGAAKVFSMPGRFLVASDALSKTMLVQSELYSLATRQALREGLRGKELVNRIADIVHDPDPAMISKAVDFSKYATFNEKPGPFTQKLIGLRETEMGGFRPARFILPFLATPANLAKIGLEYSPAGFAKLAKTGLASAEASEVIAKASIGTMAMAGFAGLAADGRLTGAAPSDPTKRDAWYRSGKVPFSVKIGNRWVGYSQMTGPLSFTLAATAGFWDAFNDKGEIPTSKRIATAGAVIGKSITDATFFRGVENLLNALNDPEKQGERFVSDTASGFVPLSGLTRNVANALDPTMRDPQGIYERIISGIPIMSEQVPAKLDVLGREQTMRGGEGALAFLPSRLPKDEARSDVDAELSRLEIYPGYVTNQLTLQSHKLELSREQQFALQQQTGSIIYRVLNGLYSSPGYADLSDEQRQKVTKAAIDAARDAARTNFLGANIRKLKLKGK